MRSPDDLLARARITNLVGTLAEGTPLQLLRPELQRHGLGISLTQQEVDWFWGDDAVAPDQCWQLESMLTLAWILGLAESLGPRDPEAYGPIQNSLDDQVLQDLAPRSESEVRDMLTAVERVMNSGEAPPPNERYGHQCLVWRRRALRWSLGVDDGW